MCTSKIVQSVSRYCMLSVFLVISSLSWSWEPSDGVPDSLEDEPYILAACRTGFREAVEYYLRQEGHDINKYWSYKYDLFETSLVTVAAVAARFGQSEILRLLVDTDRLDYSKAAEGLSLRELATRYEIEDAVPIIDGQSQEEAIETVSNDSLGNSHCVSDLSELSVLHEEAEETDDSELIEGSTVIKETTETTIVKSVKAEDMADEWVTKHQSLKVKQQEMLSSIKSEEDTFIEALIENIRSLTMEVETRKTETKEYERLIAEDRNKQDLNSLGATLFYTPQRDDEDTLEEQEGQHKFLTACQSGNKGAVDSFIEQEKTLVHQKLRNSPKERNGKGGNERDGGDSSGLYLAASNGHMKIVEVIVDQGGDAESGLVSGETPLSGAISNHHWDIVDYLQGKSINFEIITGFTIHPSPSQTQILNAFELACQTNDYETVNHMLERGIVDANVLMPRRMGPRLVYRTGLHIAAKYGHAETVAVLVEQAANINLVMKWFDGQNLDNLADGMYSPLYLAVEGNSIEVVNQLLAREDIEINVTQELSPLIAAVSRGQHQAALAIHKAQITKGDKVTFDMPSLISDVNQYGSDALQWLYHTQTCDEAGYCRLANEQADGSVASRGYVPVRDRSSSFPAHGSRTKH